MDTSAHKFLTSILIVCSAGVLLSSVQCVKLPRTTQHDFFNFPTTTTPVANPVPTPATVTIPPDPSALAVVTIPSATPVPVTPTTPSSTPVTVSPTTPATNPVTTPSTNNPVTNPVTTPATAPPTATNAPAVAGQRWCVAKTGAPEKSLQEALDYACGIGKADCAGIQQGASCYNPNTLQNHASYAFNSYYQRNPLPTSCDFGANAMITTVNPSSGSCVFTAASSSSTPTTATPTTTPPSTPTPTTTTPTLPPTTSSSSGAAPAVISGAPPTILNASYPGLGGDSTGFGLTAPTASLNSSVSQSSNQHRCSILVATSIIIGVMILDI